MIDAALGSEPSVVWNTAVDGDGPGDDVLGALVVLVVLVVLFWA